MTTKVPFLLVRNAVLRGGRSLGNATGLIPSSIQRANTPALAVAPTAADLLRRIGWLVLFASLVAMAYLSLRASPKFIEISWMPGWLARWSDVHGVTRNTVGFGALALLLGAISPRRRIRWLGYAVLAAFAVAIEVVQLWIPTRVFDWRDIVASFAGLALAALVVGLIRRGSAR